MESKILVISPNKIYRNNLLFNHWGNILFNLKNYDPNINSDLYIYSYIYDEDYSNQVIGYDDTIINNVVEKINLYNIIIFYFCIYDSNHKNKFLYSENIILKKLIECKKKVIIINPDYFDLRLPNNFLNAIKNYNFFILGSAPYYKISNIYNIPNCRYYKITYCCNELFKKYKFNDKPNMKIYLPGNYDKFYYPERYYFIQNIYPKYNNFIDYNNNHPGQFTNNENNTKDNYIKKLNSYYACFASSVRNEKIVLNKHIEIPYVGSLLLAYSSEKKEIEEYGFIDREHYISCDVNNYDEIIKYIFDENNREKIDIIRKNGMKLAREKYSHDLTAKNIIENIFLPL